MEKIGLVLEGGALRGIFTAGVIDFFLENNIKFDYVIGVSAGACNAFGYIAEAKGFVKRGMLGDNPFFGVSQVKENNKIIDLNKVFEEYTEGSNFSYEKFLKSNIEWELVATNIKTGQAEYLNEHKDIEKLKKIGIASCSMPLLTKPVKIGRKLYLDGGIADSIPIKRAFEKGCTKVVVVCTRRQDKFPHVKEPEKPIYNKVYKEYPEFLDTLYSREQIYKYTKDYILEEESKGRVVAIVPTLPEVGRLESDQDKLRLYYYHGYTKAEENFERIKKLFKKK